MHFFFAWGKSGHFSVTLTPKWPQNEKKQLRPGCWNFQQPGRFLWINLAQLAGKYRCGVATLLSPVPTHCCPVRQSVPVWWESAGTCPSAGPFESAAWPLTKQHPAWGCEFRFWENSGCGQYSRSLWLYKAPGKADSLPKCCTVHQAYLIINEVVFYLYFLNRIINNEESENFSEKIFFFFSFWKVSISMQKASVLPLGCIP